MKHLILIICILPFGIYSQNKGTFKVEFNSDFRGYDMEEFNARINDPKFIDTNLYDELASISLSKGCNFGMSVIYQPFNFVNLGVYGSTQFGEVSRDLRIIQHLYNPWETNDTTFGKRHFDVRSLQVGITADLIINQMDFWQNKIPFKKLELAWNLRVGFGSSYLYYYDRFESGLQNDSKSVYNSYGIQLNSGIKLGYIIMNHDYFSSVGIKFGYQCYRTDSFVFPAEDEVNLNFSGFTVGAYLSIGR